MAEFVSIIFIISFFLYFLSFSIATLAVGGAGKTRQEERSLARGKVFQAVNTHAPKTLKTPNQTSDGPRGGDGGGDIRLPRAEMPVLRQHFGGIHLPEGPTLSHCGDRTLALERTLTPHDDFGVALLGQS